MKPYPRASLHRWSSTTRFLPWLIFILLIAALGLLLQVRSIASGPANTAEAFAGMWKGLCRDGKPFILLSLRSTLNEVEGTASLGNVSMDAGENNAGTCTAPDPASREHATPIRNAVTDGQKLTFAASRGPQVEIILTGKNTAKLKFPGTPMEDASFAIQKESF